MFNNLDEFRQLSKSAAASAHAVGKRHTPQDNIELGAALKLKSSFKDFLELAPLAFRSDQPDATSIAAKILHTSYCFGYECVDEFLSTVSKNRLFSRVTTFFVIGNSVDAEMYLNSTTKFIPGNYDFISREYQNRHDRADYRFLVIRIYDQVSPRGISAQLPTSPIDYATNICRIITLFGPSAPTITYVEETFDDPVAQCFFSQIQQPSRDDIVGVPRPVPFLDSNVSCVNELLSEYLRFDSEKIATVNYAISRINAAVRRFKVADRVVEASIAAEALLGGGSGQGEITYKLSMRAAFLLSADAERRINIFHVLKKFYSVRSKVVHGNILKEIDAKSVADGIELITRCVSKIISMGDVPNWDDFLLTNGVVEFQQAGS